MVQRHLKRVFEKSFQRFCFLDFYTSNSFISWYLLNECSDFYSSIYLYVYWLKRSPFHLGIIVNFIAMQQFKVCLSAWAKNHVKIDQFHEIWISFLVNNLSFYTKNCDPLLDTFLQECIKTLIICFHLCFDVDKFMWR